MTKELTETTVLDNANWHFFGDFPEDLPYENAATHIAFIFGWAVRHHLESEDIAATYPKALEVFRNRLMLPTKLFLGACDGRLLIRDLSDEAGQFVSEYIESDGRSDDLTVITDPSMPTFYHIQETWQNFDKYELYVNTRFANWQKSDHKDMSLAGLDLSPLNRIDYEVEFTLKPDRPFIGESRFEFCVEEKEFVLVRTVKWSSEWGEPSYGDKKKLDVLENQLKRYRSFIFEGDSLTLRITRTTNPDIVSRLEKLSRQIGFKLIYFDSKW